ncbi:hypothetical protein [uncultured Nostoc sp.]|uniref:hypothetical protein n=1 Tax=uncultured Nostoc sp. TaxID=340711 RepID=UPI0035CBC6AB
MALHWDALTLYWDTLALHWDALTLYRDTLTMHPNAWAEDRDRLHSTLNLLTTLVPQKPDSKRIATNCVYQLE